MRTIFTHELTPLTMPTSTTEQLHIYNGLDCAVTLEVLEALLPQLDNQTAATYQFERDLQAPILEMRVRGILVDQDQRVKVIREYEAKSKIIEDNLNTILKDGIGLELNWRSPAQLKHLFYEVLGLPSIKKRNSKNEYAPTVDREALERLDVHFYAQPLISHILGLRDINKKIGVLKTDIDADGRMRTSYNIAGTTTGRLSSSLSDFGTGTNLQNIEQRLRSVFIADPGYKLAYIDKEQAESRAVGAIEWNLFRDGRYLDACESGDLHTAVCRLAWTELGWIGNLAADRAIAERPFYRQHSYRHMAKVLGHGTNYNGQPFTMAKHTKLEARLIEQFQQKYFEAFPAHRLWHAAVGLEIQLSGKLTTLTGRRRYFFGRRNDPSTIREAIAYDPQGSVGDILNQDMLYVWRANIVQLLLQIHDAILIQYPEKDEEVILPQVLKLMENPLELKHDRQLLIPNEAKVGWNWGEYCCGEVNSEKCKNCPTKTMNLDGLRKWKGTDDRRRTRTPSTSLLDRQFL